MKTTTLFLLAILPFSLALAEDEEQYRIEKMKDNVYRFTAGHYCSAFMVTEEGIIITDPINDKAADYLKKELGERFDVPVKYLIYSHNHVDHVMGGLKFAGDDVTVVAHEFAAQDIKWTKVPTAIPDVTFRDQLRIELGGSSVHLKYHGPNNGRGSVSMFFEQAKVMFVVDWIVLGRMPYKNLPGYDIHGMIHSTREILQGPDFELFIGGHAEEGTKEDVAKYLSYVEALYNSVRDGMVAGKQLEQLQKEIRLEEFSDLKMYKEWLPLNIEGVYRTLIDQSYFNFRPDIDTEFQ